MTAVNATKFNAILKKHQAEPVEPPAEAVPPDPLAILVHSFFLWEAPPSQSYDTYKRVMAATVDLNDLRVSLPLELVGMMGARYPRAAERAQRLRATLNDIYRREHAVSLARLSANAKRDARAYIESLEGIVPFVASRTLLLGYGVHGVPVDEQLRQALAEAGICPADIDLNELSASLGRLVKAEQAESAHAALLALVDAQGGGKSATRATGRSATTRRPRSPRSTSRS